MSYEFVKKLQTKTKGTGTQSDGTVHCHACGLSLPAQAQFCMSCGNALAAKDAVAISGTKVTSVAKSPHKQVQQVNQKGGATPAYVAKRPVGSSGMPIVISMSADQAPSSYRPPSGQRPPSRQRSTPSSSHPSGCMCHICAKDWPPNRVGGVGGQRALHLPDMDIIDQTFSASLSKLPYKTSTICPVVPSVGDSGLSLAPVKPIPLSTISRASLKSTEAVEGHIRDQIHSQYHTTAQAYTAFDGDSDGLISKTDFEQAIRRMFGLGFLTRAESLALFTHCDTNADGFIDMGEFVQFLKAGPHIDDSALSNTIHKIKTHLESRYHSMKNAFQALDDNHTGFLYKADFARVLQATGLQLPDHELEALIDRYDTNKDGRVSHTEFMKVMAV